MWIQPVLIIAMIAIAVYLTRSTPSDRHLAIRRILLFGSLVAGIALILVPEWLTAIARLVGIGRGTDLLVYGSIVAFLLYVVTDYKRSVKQDRATTSLARELTLAEARIEDLAARQRDDH
jgi:hypothetical protein